MVSTVHLGTLLTKRHNPNSSFNKRKVNVGSYIINTTGLSYVTRRTGVQGSAIMKIIRVLRKDA